MSWNLRYTKKELKIKLPFLLGNDIVNIEKKHRAWVNSSHVLPNGEIS